MARAGESHDACIGQYARIIVGEALDRGSEAFALCRNRLQVMLRYHRDRFEKAWGRPVGDEELLACLRRGQFAAGRRLGYDLVADVILAALLEAGFNRAATEFDRRFGPQLRQWAVRYAANDPEIADDLKADLLMSRQKSGPRIATYKGHGPLDGWLRQLLISQAERRRRQRGVVLPLEAGVGPAGVACDSRRAAQGAEPLEEYARRECTEKLAPAFEHMFDGLDEAHRAVLFMSVVDGVEQKRIAALFGVPAYKITRMKQWAIRSVARAFYRYAVNEAHMGEEAVRECLKLLLKRFPPPVGEGLIGWLRAAGRGRPR